VGGLLAVTCPLCSRSPPTSRRSTIFQPWAEAHSNVLQGEFPASMLTIVQGLFRPDFLIEMEGVAALGSGHLSSEDTEIRSSYTVPTTIPPEWRREPS